MIRVWFSTITICSILPLGALAATQPSYGEVKAAMYQLVKADDLFLWPKKLELVPYDRRTFGASTCTARAGCRVLDSCTDGRSYLDKTASPLVRNYADVAYEVVEYDLALTSLGYPRSIWSPATSDYERSEVTLANRAGPDAFSESAWHTWQGRLSEVLAAYRADHPAIYGIVLSGGCGAGEVSVTIITSPPATQVFLIPSFFYELCRAEHIAADNVDTCDHWREVVGPVTEISGMYHYFANWPGGITRRGILNVKDIERNRTTYMYSITLEKP